MNETVVRDERDTKTRILDAAERLMGREGLDVSLRAITTEAGVNLAAVNYHFQSKDALLDAVVARRIIPVNDERLRRLDALEAQYPEGSLPLEPILDALLAPVLQSSEIAHIRPLLGRIYSAPREFMTRVRDKHLRSVIDRFTDAMARALPGLPPAEIAWRFHFVVGTMVHLMNWSPVLAQLTGGLCDDTDAVALTKRVVVYAAAGFRAPRPDYGENLNA